MADERPGNSTPHLNENAFAELEKEGDVILTAELRRELNDAILKCILVKDRNEAYSPGAIEDRKKVESHAAKLKEALNALNAAAYLSVVLGDHQGEIHFKTPELADADPDQFIEQLDAVAMQSKRRIQEDFIRRDGRSRDTHIDRLCEIASDIYERSGGRAAIGGERKGPFARFMHGLNNYIPKSYRAASGDALAKKAQEAIRRRKERSERLSRSKLKGPLKSRKIDRLK